MIYKRYVYTFKCLSHRSRLRLLELLITHGEMSVSEMVATFEGELVGQESFEDRDFSSVSRNLNMLKQYGFVKSRRDGKTKYYSVDLAKIEEEFSEFIQFLKDSEGRTSQMVMPTRRPKPVNSKAIRST
ncbi:helix-turn-helix transcriptional regulator [Candidatus Acetothermia bacterium]|nr:helix-turn-helix transcriptional regulator [Candidatus Acetothermia bacterium]